MSASWDAAVKKAMDILGEKAKIPKWPTAIDKAKAEENKAFAEFDKVRQDLKKKLVTEQDAVEKIKDAFSQFQDEIGGANFGLNPRDKDDKKKIDDAREILSGELGEYMEARDDDFKNLKELDKHLVNIADYEPGSA
jgi:predicted  nucleic acid-binding Zn-ribbon protein